MKRFNIGKSNVIKLAIGGAAVLSVVVVSTLAYMTFQTNSATNVFGVSANIHATLTEPSFDAIQQASASEMVPGDNIQKNPQVTNQNYLDDSTKGMPEWASIQLQFTEADGSTLLSAADMALLANVLEINFDTSATGPWLTGASTDNYFPANQADTGYYDVTYDGTGAPSTVAAGTGATAVAPDNTENFYYSAQLADTDSTTPLFGNVILNPSATSDQIAAIRAMGGFDIVVNGVAVQVVTGDPSDLTATPATPGTSQNGQPAVTGTGIMKNLNAVFAAPVTSY
jgi:hypothetical protein